MPPPVVPLPSAAAGVPHIHPLFMSDDPEAVSLVRRIDRDRWNNKRPCGVAFSFQCREYLVQTEFNEATNILANDPSRLALE